VYHFLQFLFFRQHSPQNKWRCCSCCPYQWNTQLFAWRSTDYFESWAH